MANTPAVGSSSHMFPVGAAPQQFQVGDVIRNVFGKMMEFGSGFARLFRSVSQLNEHFGKLAELSGRLTAGLMLLVGLPRVMRSDLYHTAMKAAGAGGKGGFTPGGGGGGEGGGGGWQGWDKHFAEKKKYAIKDEEESLGRWKATQEKKREYLESRALSDAVKSIPVTTTTEQLEKQLEDAHIQAAGGSEEHKAQIPILTAALAQRKGPFVGPSPQSTAQRMLVGMASASSPIVHPMARGMSQAGAEQAETDRALGSRSLIKRFGDGFLDTLRNSPRLRAFGNKFLEVVTNGRRSGESDADYKGRLANWGKFNSFMEKATYGFLALGAATQSLLHAASPDLFATFTGSLQLLAAVVGESLIPLFMDWSKKVQGWVKDWEQMSPGKKKAFGTAVEYGLYAVGGLAAFNILNKLLLGIPARAIVAGLGSMVGALGGATSAVAALGAAAVVAAGILGYKGAKSDSEARNKVIRGWNELGQAATTTQADIAGRVSPETAKTIQTALHGTGPEKAKAIELLEQEQIFHTERALLGERALGQADKAAGSFGPAFHRAILGGDPGSYLAKRDNVIKAFAGEQEKQRIIGDVLQSIKTGKEIPVSAQQAKNAEGLLMAIRSVRVSPQYQSVEEAYKNVQLRVLDKDPLEQKLERTITKHLIKMLENDRTHEENEERAITLLQKIVGDN